MRTYYFVGGPTPGNREAFFRRLQAAGGMPAGWSIFPHTSQDGKALHIAHVKSDDEIAAHLALFAGIYEASAAIEVMDGR